MSRSVRCEFLGAVPLVICEELVQCEVRQRVELRFVEDVHVLGGEVRSVLRHLAVELHRGDPDTSQRLRLVGRLEAAPDLSSPDEGAKVGWD